MRSTVYVGEDAPIRGAEVREHVVKENLVGGSAHSDTALPSSRDIVGSPTRSRQPLTNTCSGLEPRKVKEWSALGSRRLCGPVAFDAGHDVGGGGRWRGW